MTLRIETLMNGPFAENCYLVWCDETHQAILIDPGDEAPMLLDAISSRKLTLTGIFNTHGHLDHAGAAAQIQRELRVPFSIHQGDEKLVKAIAQQSRMFGLPAYETPAVSLFLSDGETISVGNHQGSVIHTPGHTEGGVCFHFDKTIFVGDTLFSGSVGRTDLPGGDYRKLMKSIHERLLRLDGDSVVYCGHGQNTTIGQEKRSNPFLQTRPL